MKKKLVIKFWKTELALAMQILEQEGLPKHKTNNGIVRISLIPYLFYETGEVYLRGQETEWDYGISSAHFESNTDRDAYIDKITQAITDELFTGTGMGELMVGEMCVVSGCLGGGGSWKKRKLIAILPDNYNHRFLAQSDDDENDWFCYEHARPICKRTEPKVETNGEIVMYTWEEE